MIDDTKTIAHTAKDPGRIAELARQIASGELSPVELMQRCLDRIDAVESEVQAWQLVDRERAMELARKSAIDAAKNNLHGPLHGIPVGVKDIIDVAGLPTRCNSKSRADAGPAKADAEVVLQLRSQGAIVLGKLHTTEFAYHDPSPARNPWNTGHTPGGSSSGSGAGIAAGMVPLALGTQTIASVNRPAAYCGVSAFKPSTRSLSTAGVAPFAASYDTIGFFGACVEDAIYAYQASMPAFLSPDATPKDDSRNAAPVRVALIDDPLIGDAKNDVKQAHQRMADAFSNAGHVVEQRASNISFESLRLMQKSTSSYECGRVNAGFLDLAKGQIGDHLLEMIRFGLSISDDEYLATRRDMNQMRSDFLGANQDVDVFLWPAVPDIAPHGLASTGDNRYIGTWTAIGGPIVTIPAGLGRKGLPLACIVAGHPGRDAQMCTWANQLAEAGELSPFAAGP